MPIQGSLESAEGEIEQEAPLADRRDQCNRMDSENQEQRETSWGLTGTSALEMCRGHSAPRSGSGHCRWGLSWKGAC